MGRLRGMKDETLKLDKTIALAKYPNVHVKLTLITECTSAEYPYKNVQPEVRRLIDAFSPRRSFWGTDLSVMLSRSTCTYTQAVTLFTEEMGYSKSDQEWILGRGSRSACHGRSSSERIALISRIISAIALRDGCAGHNPRPASSAARCAADAGDGVCHQHRQHQRHVVRLSVLPVLAGDLHVAPTEIGLAMAVPDDAGHRAAPLFGIIADLRGRRALLIFGLTLFGLGGGAAAAAPTYGWFLACRAVQGVGMSALLPLTIVLISDILSRSAKSTASLKVVIDRVGMILLPLIGGTLAAILVAQRFRGLCGRAAGGGCGVPPDARDRHAAQQPRFASPQADRRGPRRAEAAALPSSPASCASFSITGPHYLPLLLTLRYSGKRGHGRLADRGRRRPARSSTP